MGEVWRGRDQRLGSAVAIKFLTRTDAVARRRFHEEAEIAARLPGAHVVRVFDRGELDGMPFLVMEFLEGETLRERLRIVGRFSAEHTLRIVGQVAEGLGQAHAAGFVHRDIKPENIFLSGSGSTVVVKLLDFGIAKSRGAHRTRSGDWVGTPHYASPEQLANASSLGPATDCWSLAAVTFECLTGERPFQARSAAATLAAIASGQPTSRAMNEAFPARLRHWFRGALAPDPAARPEDMASFIQGLATALRECTVRQKSDNTTLTTSEGPLLDAARHFEPPRAGRARVGLWATGLLGLISTAAFWFSRPDAAGTGAEAPVPTHAAPPPAVQPAASLSGRPRAPSLDPPAPELAHLREPVTASQRSADPSEATAPIASAVLVRSPPEPRRSSAPAEPERPVGEAPPEASQRAPDVSEEELLWSRRK